MSSRFDRLVGYQVNKSNRYVIRIVIATILMTLAILAILPFTQALSGDPRDKTIRSVDVANLPPPEPPPPEPPPPEEEEEEEVDELDTPPPPMSISQLELALNPGMGGSTFFEIGGFETTLDTVADLGMFSIADLDQPPRRIKGAPPNWPVELQIQKIGGLVRLKIMIDERGNVEVLEILESPHPDLARECRLAIESWKYEPPLKDGERVRTYFELPIFFQ